MQAHPAGADATPAHSSWHLQSVEAINKASGMKTSFNYNDWITLASSSVVIPQASSVQYLHHYTARVATSNIPGADFEGQVFLSWSGWWGSAEDVSNAGCRSLRL